MPKNIKPMLATLVDKPFDKEGWLYELLWLRKFCLSEDELEEPLH